MVVSIQKSTLTQQITERLKDRILEGKLVSGDRLWAQDLANDLGVSIVPVKEALLLLQGEGLITNNPRRSSVVKSFTITEMKELYDLRRMFEIEALRQIVSADGLTTEFIEALEWCNDKIKKNGGKGAVALEFDHKFHEILVGAGGNQMLIELYGRLNSQAHIIRYATWKFGPRAEINYREHVAIIDALKAGNTKAAERAIESHLTSMLKDRRFVQSMETNSDHQHQSAALPLRAATRSRNSQ